ncbi:aminotransferase class V-fold PLP-dependent enzyme [Marivirga sp. S37H4]|uniref:phosphoserine transaminase n=1 Tax=Marivirga aurantiaca TaxID=2802615 RepID=A0A934X2G9_9BACT|nr:aminotransferase class V-fold PLP-dependent enzyme [Marivirga aurantiaca]MBK6267261.1 aminotransferase class V-fold PLP-dependent enzyme [Marivirga aurantiaca]
MSDIYFTPGPTALYFTAEEHIKNAIRNGVVSTSHRGQQFKDIYKACADNLKELMNIPDNYHVLITSSANEAWERIIQNCVRSDSYHISNGPFAARFEKVASQLQKRTHDLKLADGGIPSLEQIDVPEKAEIVTICLNESGTGAAFPLALINQIREKYPEKLIAIDGVSAVPVTPVDFTKIDTLYFSVQKAFGLPAGLGIWIANERCLSKAVELANEGLMIGSYHQLPEMVEKAMEYQTTETPNILGIYTLAKVAEDMLTKGVTAIRREIDYKAAILNIAVEEHPQLSHFIENPAYRSKTVSVIKTSFENSKLINHLKEKHIQIGTGYGKYKPEHIRIANFPTHSKEQMEMLVDMISAFKV